MENNDTSEYSEQIRYFDWPWESWRLDKDEEDQLRADIEGDTVLLEYLKRRKKIGTQGFTA